MKKIIIVLYLIFFSVFLIKPINLKAETKMESFRDTTYYRTLKSWKKVYQVKSNEKIIYVDDVLDQNPDINYYDDENYQGKVFAPAKDEIVNYHINVTETGLYRIGLDYYYDTDFTSQPRIALKLDDEIPYNELSAIHLEVEWKNIKQEDSKRYNRYGDELLPFSEPVLKYYHYYLEDEISGGKEPYYLLLNAGENKISIQTMQDNLLLGNIYLGGQEQIPSYENYRSMHSGKIIENKPIIIQAEDVSTKNDMEIKASYYNSVAMTPSSYKQKIFNILDGYSTSRGGTRVNYQIDVPETGYYQLSVKYKQNSLSGLAVARNLYINGKIPFQEMQTYLFPSTKAWVNHTFGNEEPYLFYLEKGKQTISLEASTNHVTETIDSLYDVMEKINDVGLTIKSITGSSTDTQIDWNILKYLPDLSNDLNNYASQVIAAYDYVNSLNANSKRASEVVLLEIAANQLRRLAKSPNKIQNRLNELCDGSGSAYQYIGTAIGTLVNETLDLDFLVFHDNNYKLTNPNGNFFARLWYSIKSFFYSFFDKRYAITENQNDEDLEIWVAQSSLYANILENMIDQDFTNNTGIKVRLNILPSSQKLVLNNATGSNPDVVLGIDSWEPYTFALRGMLEDLSINDGFADIAANIYSNNFTPLIYDQGVYGIPETQGMQLLFYRTDILNYLGLTPPDTWDDVLKILPVLQSYQMNYYHPLGSDSAYKGFGLTSSFFYMFNAEVYSRNGFNTVLNEEENIEAIRFMTDIFNIYNLPQQVNSFFEHFRSGTLPIGLGSIDLYLQLKYACPELAGQWAVLPVPGILNSETGLIERWTTTYGKCSIMFASSNKKEEAWKFLKWWHQTDTQTEYVNNIKIHLGEKYLLAPANLDSLALSPWDDEIKEQLLNKQGGVVFLPSLLVVILLNGRSAIFGIKLLLKKRMFALLLMSRLRKSIVN